MKLISITLSPWKWQGMVLVGGTSADFRMWVAKHLEEFIEASDNAMGHAFMTAGKPWVIWLQSIKDIPSLAHEALHITAGVMDARGLKFSIESEEAYTYTMEDIIRQTLAAKKWRKA